MLQRIEHGEVEGLRVGRFGSQINTNCILYRLGTTVVDTGPPNQWARVRRFLREREVRRVVVTHHHEDHSGNLGAIQRSLQPEVLSPESGIPPLAKGFPLHPYQRVIWGRPLRVRAVALPAQIPLDDGRYLEPIQAPGHSADMTCFLDPQRGWLFSGDLYISSKTRYLRADEDLPRHMESLRRILEYDFATLFCSHRGVIESGKEALRRKLEFLEALCERVRVLRDEGRSKREITRIVLGREDLLSWMTGMHFAKHNLVEGCLRALELRESGER